MRWLIISILLLTTLVACALVEKVPSYLELKTLSSSPTYESSGTIHEGIVPELSVRPLNYSGTYSEVATIHHGGTYRSGATDTDYNNTIIIESKDGDIIAYEFNGSVGKATPYLALYYDRSTGKMCRTDLVLNGGCKEVNVSQIKFDGPLQGCRGHAGGGPLIAPDCYCDNERVPIETGMPCSQEIPTENLRRIWTTIISYPETGKGDCIIMAKDKDADPVLSYEYFFPCEQQGFVLTPDEFYKAEWPRAPYSYASTDFSIKQPYELLGTLSNVHCAQRSGAQPTENDCQCNIDSIRVRTCADGTPPDFDAEIKQQIKEFLEDKTFSYTVGTDIRYGRCYSAMHKNVEQSFCFDRNSALTFAQWGYSWEREDSYDTELFQIVRKQ